MLTSKQNLLLRVLALDVRDEERWPTTLLLAVEKRLQAAVAVELERCRAEYRPLIEKERAAESASGAEAL